MERHPARMPLFVWMNNKCYKSLDRNELKESLQ